MINTPVDIKQLKQLAATGHFRSVALWLNYPLVPQAIYAQVKTDHYPGYLKVLLEFEHPPNKDPLIRLVCNRVCRLESKVIRGIYLIGRLIGSNQPLWQQRVRLPQHKRPEKQPQASAVVSQPISSEPTTALLVDPSKPSEAVAPKVEVITAKTYSSDVLNAVPSYLIPRESTNQERRRRPNHSVVSFPVVQIRRADIDSTQTSAQRRVSRRRLAPKEALEQQFKYMRAIVLTGSAAAAFILGCVTEVFVFQRGQLARKSSPMLPTFNEDAGWRALSDVETQAIVHRSAMRDSDVSAALEQVAVMPHEPSSNPEDPTVTLLFGGDVAVGDVPLQTPDAVGQVLGELDIFREADVAMVGLGNSLAKADTSLQENYFERSRPDAADALLKGGIDIVGLTSEQTMDFGRQGLIETLETLDSAGIYRVGAGRDYQEARRPEILEVKGQRIAYLSYAPNSDDVATLGRAGLNIQERDNIIEDIAALRKAVDWIVVNYRWYGDLETEPNARQVNLSRTAIDAGADLVVGYHPQQIQGAELYKARPIVYALGDFIFQDEPLDDHDTATLRVSLREKQMKVEFLPISVRGARPQAATGKAAKAILEQIRYASDALPAPLQFPTILDAVTQRQILLQPQKPIKPLKSLGELEPGPLNNSDSTQESFTPETEGFVPYPSEIGIPEPEAFGSETFDSDSSEPGMVDSDLSAAEVFEPAVDLDALDIAPTTPWHKFVEGHGPLDSFNTQPDTLEMDGAIPDDSPRLPTPAKPMAIPKEDSAPKLLNEELELVPDVDSNADILLPNSESTLEGYDELEDWGEKSSPHKEFNPIQEHFNSLDSSNPVHHPSLSPTNSAEEEPQASDAITPHDEPLVGPLS